MDMLEMQLDLEIMESNHLFESAYDIFLINEKEVLKTGDKDLTNALYTEAVGGLVNKVKKVIESIGNAISEIITNIKTKIIIGKDKKDAEESLKKVKQNISNIDKSKTYEVYDDQKIKDQLNMYIKELCKLERKVMNLKFDNKINNLNAGVFVVEYNKIEKELEALNEKFDKGMLDDNKHIIKLATADAIRFSEKQLDSIKVDFDEVEKNSKKVLKMFKEDINGCDVPVKLNLIQKMSNALGTRVRKTVNTFTTYKHRSLKVIILIASALTAISYGVTHKDEIKAVIDNVKKDMANVK